MSSTKKTRTQKPESPDRPGAGHSPSKPASSPALRGRDLLVRCPEEVRDDDKLVAVARLGKPWGVRGAITVRLHNPDSDLAWADEIVWLRGDGFPTTPVEVDRWEDKSGKLLIILAGIRTPQAAAALTHLELHVPSDWLPEPDENEAYVHELIGMTVIDEARGELGRIAHIFTTGANDVWVVQGGKGEELIPAVKDFVLGIDREAGVVRVSWSLD